VPEEEMERPEDEAEEKADDDSLERTTESISSMGMTTRTQPLKK
jgi:hypothetical protein